MNNIRVAAYLAKREKLGELLDAADVAKEKFETLLSRGGNSEDIVAANADYKRAAEAVFQQDEFLAKERSELVNLGLLKSRKKN